ncbi:MarR family winged helix-turn-helix transcriptional regulator [Pseudodesulfovibrio sp.]|uniref:MarR family winged helix-turn-helix transcriptional regulator n=1 Tax=unclassified Pseudodesulfovibrio TaxID=2661612 RepID=UPI003B007139
MDEFLNESFFLRLSRLFRLYDKSLRNRLALHGVNPGYLAVLQCLWANEMVTQTDLGHQLDIEQATLSNTLRRMERDGLIQRTPNPNDRRYRPIALTNDGRASKEPVLKALDELQQVVNEGLTTNDRRYFYRILRQMTARLEDDIVEPLFVLTDEIPE